MFTEYFEDSRETSEYLSIINEHKNYCGEGEFHHVLPKSIWPEFAKCDWNIVKLPYKEHFRVHCLLPNMLTGSARSKMLFAWNQMSRLKDYSEQSAEEYESFRKELNLIISETTSNTKWTEERRELARNRMLGESNHQFGKRGEDSPNFGKVGPNKGRTFSEKTRKILSEITSGEGNPMYGKTHSDETKLKISLARLGKPGHSGSDTQKEAARQTCLNRKWTEEERKKCGARLCIPVEYNGVTYESQKALSLFLGVSKSTVGKMVKRGEVKRLTT